MKYPYTLEPAWILSLSDIVFDTRILFPLFSPLNFGMLPSIILRDRKAVSYSSPTPLKATPRKSESVFSMPCVMAYLCTCFTPSRCFSTFIIESFNCIGFVSEVCKVKKLATVMSLPNPTTLSRMVCLKPSTTATETSITARPRATPMVAIRIAGRLTFCPSPSPLYIFLAMNNGKFIISCKLNNKMKSEK